jgi:hypothetical protein
LGHPPEGQHSAAFWRDPGPSAPGEGFNIVRQGSMPNGADGYGCVYESPPREARGAHPLNENTDSETAAVSRLDTPFRCVTRNGTVLFPNHWSAQD